MKTKNKNKKKTKFIFTTTLAISFAGIGIGSYFLTDYLLNLNKIKNILPDNVNSSGIQRGNFIKQEKDWNNEKEPTYVELIEYEYNGKYFLNKEGLKKLNRKINKYLPFSSEIDQLKYISFNDALSLPKDINQINGQYKPFTMELDIDVRRFMDISNDISIDKKVDFVFATILHEYGHHLANTYITSNQENDPLIYNKEQLRTYLNKDALVNKFIPEAFLSKWEDSLNYNNPIYSEIENKQYSTNNHYPIYKDFSSRDLYRIANYTPENIWEVLSKNPNKEYVAPSEVGSFKYSLDSVLKYSYGIDELLTRHLVSFNYISENSNIDDYLLFGYGDKRAINSFAPDILQRNYIFSDFSFTYSTDNIFGGNIMYQENDFINNFKLESKATKILEAYREVFGYGKLISQIYMDNSNNRNVESEDKKGLHRETIKPEDFNKIKIGGYIPKSRNIKKLVLKLKNNENIFININKINSNSLKTKLNPLDNKYLNNDDDYISYLSDQIDFNDPKLNFGNIENISYWEDINNDGEMIDNEIILIQENDIVQSRQVGTFRESFSLNLYKKGIWTHKDTHQKEIYNLSWNSSNKKIQLNKTKVLS